MSNIRQQKFSLSSTETKTVNNQIAEERVAYDILCKVLDKLNTDIKELTNHLKISLDRLDKMDAVRGKSCCYLPSV